VDEVAKLLGASPAWLPMLEFWSNLVGYRRKPTKWDDDDTRKMIKAASYLHDQLAVYAKIEEWFGFEVPEEVDTA